MLQFHLFTEILHIFCATEFTESNVGSTRELRKVVSKAPVHLHLMLHPSKLTAYIAYYSLLHAVAVQIKPSSTVDFDLYHKSHQTETRLVLKFKLQNKVITPIKEKKKSLLNLSP